MTTKYDLVLPYVIQHDYVRLQNMLDTDKEGMVKLRDHKGRTLLHVMAALGDLEGMRLLLRYRAPVDARDDDGKTPLYYAVDRGHMPCVRALVKRGAVVNPPGDTSPFAVVSSTRSEEFRNGDWKSCCSWLNRLHDNDCARQKVEIHSTCIPKP